MNDKYVVGRFNMSNIPLINDCFAQFSISIMRYGYNLTVKMGNVI